MLVFIKLLKDVWAINDDFLPQQTICFQGNHFFYTIPYFYYNYDLFFIFLIDNTALILVSRKKMEKGVC